MAKRRNDYQLKKKISIRLQRIIVDRFESLYAFTQAMQSQGKKALASTVRGWLPPQRRWKAKPDGADVRRIDWESVRIPEGSTLIEFCDLLSIRADYILLGEGQASRSQTRKPQQLEEDVAAHLAEALKASGFVYWASTEIDGRRALADIVKAAKVEAAMWQSMVDLAPARFAAESGMLLDEIGRMSRHLPRTDAAKTQFAVLSQYGALFEAAVQSAPSSLRKLGTQYLSVPRFGDDDLPMPTLQIEARFQAGIKRFDAEQASARRTAIRLAKSARDRSAKKCPNVRKKPG